MHRRINGDTMLPLEGIKVIDLTTWAFAPARSAALGDWGAEMIKIEHPETGDNFRWFLTVDGISKHHPLEDLHRKSVSTTRRYCLSWITHGMILSHCKIRASFLRAQKADGRNRILTLDTFKCAEPNG